MADALTDFTVHHAIPYDYARYRRVLRRTTVAGAGPVVGPFSLEARAAAAASVA